MEITVEYLAKERLEKFLIWLKKRAENKIHKNNGDIIADFVDKVVVVELKRLENDTETITEEIEVPDEIMTEPLKEMKKRFDKTFKDFMEGNGINSTEIENTSESEANPATPAPVSTSSSKKSRTGNGHGRKKKRDLTNDEKNTIKSEFTAMNGQIAEDACVEIHKKFDPDVTIFQVTGFVTLMHKYVREGKITLSNIDNYEKFLQQHRDLWATYNSRKYIAMRAHV